MSEWISVKDRPPPPMQTVILCIGGIVIPGWNESTQPEEDPSYCTWEGQFGIEDVTHWMPLPEPPNNQTGRNMREDDIMYFPVPCEKCNEYIHIDDESHRFRCGKTSFRS